MLRICSLVFSEILHRNRNLEIKKMTSAFFRKCVFAQKLAKKAQNQVFLTCHKILSSFFAEKNVNWKSSKFSVFLYKPHIWENPCSQVIAQNAIVQLVWKILWSWISQEALCINFFDFFAWRYWLRKYYFWVLLLVGCNHTQTCLDLQGPFG